jgi:hypothetical protein
VSGSDHDNVGVARRGSVFHDQSFDRRGSGRRPLGRESNRD